MVVIWGVNTNTKDVKKIQITRELQQMMATAIHWIDEGKVGKQNNTTSIMHSYLKQYAH